MNPKLLGVALVSLLLGGALAHWSLSGGPSSSGVIQSGALPATGKALVGGPFSLTDHRGQRVSDRDFRGQPMLVFFGFTTCPDICPSGLQVIGAALDQLGPAGAKIVPVFVTIDPQRDTIEKMAAYVASFHPRLIGLTGSAEEVAGMLKAYRVYARKVPDERDPARYTMDHSSIAYLMGPGGEMVAFAPELTRADSLAALLRKGLDGKS
jgi:protein SCO1